MIKFGIYIIIYTCIPRFRIFFGNLLKMNGLFSGGDPPSWNLSVERLVGCGKAKNQTRIPSGNLT